MTEAYTVADPRDQLTQDQVLQSWDSLKKKLAELKEQELEYRKYVVQRAFPQAVEGTNVLELGNGYSLKAAVKYNYKLLSNEVVEKCLADIAAISDEGKFIADRLVSWSPHFLLTEYRDLTEAAKSGSNTAQTILAKCGEMLEVSEAAPTVNIVAPKKAKS